VLAKFGRSPFISAVRKINEWLLGGAGNGRSLHLVWTFWYARLKSVDVKQLPKDQDGSG
jgi:hypothetical protein